MASLIRLGAIRALGNSFVRTGAMKQLRCINTSTKKTSSEGETCAPAESKNWITYGFDTTDKRMDRINMHVSGFVTISLCLVFGSLFLIFAPDPKLGEWAQREAYLELRRRESQGLPPIDPWYIHPDKVTLPTDEELGDMEIVI